MAKKLSKFSLHPPTDKPKEGMRIRLISMVDDPNPVPPGTEGTIRLVDDTGTIHVRWDDGRQLGVIPGIDQYQLLESNSGGSSIKAAIKKTPSIINKSMPKPTKISSSISSSMKSSGIKPNTALKNFKVEGEIKDLTTNQIKGGKADKVTLKGLAKKHNISLEDIKKEVRLGIKIEKEHVGNDVKRAQEIAMDHVFGFKDFYTNKRYGAITSEKGLKKSENKKVNENHEPLFLLDALTAWLIYNDYKKYGLKGTLKNMGNNLKELMKDFIQYSTTVYGTPVSKDMTEYQFRELLKKFKSDKTDYMSAGGGGTTTASALGASGTYTGNAFAPGGVLTRKIKEATTTAIDKTTGSDGSFNSPAFRDLDHDGWKFDDEPTWKGGEIVDPLAKVKTNWKDENIFLKNSKTTSNKVTTKENLLRMINNRLNESKESTKYYVTKNSGPGTKVVKGPVSKSQAEDFANKENEKILKQQETIRKGQVTSDAAKGVPLRKEKYKTFNVITDKELDNVGKGWWDEVEKEVKDVELDETTTFSSV